MSIIIIFVLAGILLGWHSGHVHSNYRRARSAGHGRRPALRVSSRGVWASVPIPGTGFRISHRL